MAEKTDDREYKVAVTVGLSDRYIIAWRKFFFVNTS